MTEAVSQDLQELSINTIRMLAVDAVQKANSGHPGLPMGAAAMAYTIWTRHLKHNPTNPGWIDRDRFILSAGHGSMLIYALLHLTGYDLPMEQLMQFRQLHSITPGHPESNMTPGVEVTTGPLGQGFANGVGLAVAERFLSEMFNTDEHTIVDHYTYAIVSDGDLQEGVAAEAASYAGTQALGKIIYLYDDNEISIEGDTDVTFREDVGARFAAYGWHVIGPVDGMDVEAVDKAIIEAKAVADKPSLIVCTTTIGYGSPNKAGTHGVHGSPLGPDEVKATKENLGWPLEPVFYVPGEALEHFREAVDAGVASESAWQSKFDAYAAANPDMAAQFARQISGELAEGWANAIPTFTPDDGPVATRAAGGTVLNAIFQNTPELLGGSADLAPSTKTWLNDTGRFGWDHGGHNLQFGIREHAMGSIALGIAHHGGALPYTATFLTFADYMRPPMRLASLSEERVVFVFTHDSIGLGEDGPTHQPVEHLASLRAIPRLRVFRPADANEVADSWRQAVLYTNGPSCIVLSRQKLPIFDLAEKASKAGTAQGAYILKDSEDVLDVVLIATGSEVSLAIDASEALASEGIKARVVSMPCMELFDEQSDDYKNGVLPAGTPKLAIEAGISMGWHKYVLPNGGMVTLDRFGESAPGDVVMKELGFSVENVVAKAKELL